VLYNGAGVASGDINQDGRPDLFFCDLSGHNALFLNLGGWRFREATQESGLATPLPASRGAAFADLNGDGALDLLVSVNGRGVHVFLFAPDGRMLVQKRSKDRAQYSSALDCSVSEHVKAGESYLETAIRGMKEEMGVEGIDVKPLVKFRMEYGPNDNEISTLYEGVVDPARVKFDPVEIEEVYYFSMSELEDMVNEGRAPLCGWFVELLHWRSGKPVNKMVVLK